MKGLPCFALFFMLLIPSVAVARIGESLSDCQNRYGSAGFDDLGNHRRPGLVAIDDLLDENEKNIGTNRLRQIPECFYLLRGNFFQLDRPKKGDFFGAPYYLTRAGEITIHLRFLGGKCVFIGFKKYGETAQFAENPFSAEEVSELLERNFGSKKVEQLDESSNAVRYYADDVREPSLVAMLYPADQPTEVVFFNPSILSVFSAENASRDEASDRAQKTKAEQNLRGF